MAAARSREPAKRPATATRTAKAAPAPAAAPAAKPKGPYVAADKVFPEMTWRALAIGVVLSAVLGAANMYVGLRAGLTVSATIPSAVITMTVLRRFKGSNILENAIGMTTASAGEALGAGLIFTIPAFILTGVWTDIHVGETILLGLVGGTLGVLFTVPLRRALVVEAKLPYPEGIATAQVLVVGDQAAEGGGKGTRLLAAGMLVGAGTALAGLGLRLWQDAAEGAQRIGNTVAYIGTSLSPILMAVGYIVGLRIASLIMIGGVLGFLVFSPALLALNILPTNRVVPDLAVDPQGALLAVWAGEVRLIGAGAMITGGLYTLWKIRGSLQSAVKEGAAGFQQRGQTDTRIRTEQDLRFDRVLLGIGLLALPVAVVAYIFTGSPLFALFGLLATIVAGFFFSSVAGYLAGVVGSSNNPISGVTIVTLLFTSFGLLALGAVGKNGIAAALGVAAMICTGAAIAGDNLQDLKTGYLVGSTPRRQQLALIAGVVAMAIAGPLVLSAIQSTAGIGSNSFPAPQAFVMATLVGSIFSGTANIPMLAIGAVLGAVLIALRLPVLPVAVGIYLPFTLSTPIFLGGALRWAAERISDQRAAKQGLGAEQAKKHKLSLENTGVLFSSGLIAGEALMGIGVIFVRVANPDPGFFDNFAPLVAGLLGAAALLIFGGERKWRAPAAAGALLLGLLLSGALLAHLVPYTPRGDASVFWPGLLIFLYVGLLMVYLPVRNVVLGKPPEDVPGVGAE